MVTTKYLVNKSVGAGEDELVLIGYFKTTLSVCSSLIAFFSQIPKRAFKELYTVNVSFSQFHSMYWGYQKNIYIYL